MNITLINTSMLRQDELRWDKAALSSARVMLYSRCVENNNYNVKIIDGEALRIPAQG